MDVSTRHESSESLIKIEEDSDELEYPQELFSAVDLLSLQFLEVSMVLLVDKGGLIRVLVFYSAGGVVVVVDGVSLIF
ncbi:hypothetical protein Tco_1079575 [Tanacetum coccineum]|uniref:Uncharacterized protein n=1 Tax=Tanacetum coccineum TaxID=301880 RepID=A0ABQ5HSA0_9ASTR